MQNPSHPRVSLPLLALLLIGSAVLGGRRTLQPAERDRIAVGRPLRPTRMGLNDLSLGGWKRVLLRAYHGVNDDRIQAVAGGVAFFALVAIFPAITAFVSLYGLFANSASLQNTLSAAAGVMPASAFELVRGEVLRIMAKSNSTLGLTSAAGILLALWSANAGTKAIFDALNVAYGEKETRGFIALNLRSLGFTAAGLVFLLLAAGAIIVVPLVLSALGLAAGGTYYLAVLRWPVLFIVAALCFSALYRFGPSNNRPGWRWITPGATLAAALWLAVSSLFSLYLSKFADYDASYGSLGAAIGLMMWMWLSVIVILAGAELDSEIVNEVESKRPADVAQDPHR